MNPFLIPILLVLFLFNLGYCSAAWPNEQAGSAVLCDWPFDSASGKGFGAPSGGAGRIVADATAPLSPANVWRNTRNKTMNDGGAVAFNLPNAYQNEVFFGYWFKASNPHYGWFGWYQKISMVNDVVPHIYMKMQEIDETAGTFLIVGHPEKVIAAKDWENAHIAPDGIFWPNVHGESYRVGQWYRVEIYCKRSTTSSSRDGIYRWWVNGTLAGNYTTMNFGTPLRKVLLANIWDSVYPDLPYEEYVQYDHLRVSLPAGVVKPLAITASALPAGTIGKTYVTTLQAQGGLVPYTWSLESGALPSGLTLFGSTGFISGTPTANGVFNFTVKVNDATASAAPATRQFTISVGGTPSIYSSRSKTAAPNHQMRIESRGSSLLLSLQQPASEPNNFALYDLGGKKVLECNIASMETTKLIERKSLPNGVYIGKLTGNHGSQLLRFSLLGGD